MGEIIQILIVIIVIVFAVVKQVAENSEKEKKKRSKVRLPQEDKEAQENYKRTGPEPFLSHEYDLYNPSPETAKQPSAQKKNKKMENPPPVREGLGENREFDIQSSEEVRRGIIWSEILNRKY